MNPAASGRARAGAALTGRLLEPVKRRLRPAIRRLRWLGQRLRGVAPSLPVEAGGGPLRRLGSDYGGWTVRDEPGLRGTVLVSAGLGEDASFDVEFARAYQARVLLVDPTPRAVEHFRAIRSRLGLARARGYADGGAQPIDAYELAGIDASQLTLCERALWREAARLRFYAPADPAHVSHSLVNFRNGYAEDSAHIEVQAITIDELLRDHGLGTPGVLKLDIEGAEIEVLDDMLAKGIRPRQVLVEYDELAVPSRRSKRRIETTHRGLSAAGYRLIHRVQTNFTYVLRGG